MNHIEEEIDYLNQDDIPSINENDKLICSLCNEKGKEIYIYVSQLYEHNKKKHPEHFVAVNGEGRFYKCTHCNFPILNRSKINHSKKCSKKKRDKIRHSEFAK